MEPSVFNIGGVPEHFNLPWLLARDEGTFEERGLRINWQNYPGGTGAMAGDLRENKLDIALLLTEGAVADIVNGGNYKIAGLYVDSPLIWGIHVDANSPYQQMGDLEYKTFAISRLGSGSHLMAFVNAQQQGWDPQKIRFNLVGNMEGARTALSKGDADAFMWEKFMTKPLVDSGEWRRIGECPTPWPCFVAVVRNEIAHRYPEAVLETLAIVRKISGKYKERTDAVSLIRNQFHLAEEDIKAWLNHVQWATHNSIQQEMLENIMDTLLSLKIIGEVLPPEDICHPFVALV